MLQVRQRIYVTTFKKHFVLIQIRNLSSWDILTTTKLRSDVCLAFTHISTRDCTLVISSYLTNSYLVYL